MKGISNSCRIHSMKHQLVASPMDKHGYFCLGTQADYVSEFIGQVPFVLEWLTLLTVKQRPLCGCCFLIRRGPVSPISDQEALIYVSWAPITWFKSLI
jgi:hypothetical protein